MSEPRGIPMQEFREGYTDPYTARDTQWLSKGSWLNLYRAWYMVWFFAVITILALVVIMYKEQKDKRSILDAILAEVTP